MTIDKDLLPADGAVNKRPAALHSTAVVLLALYAGFMYFQAATASIGEDYQPGISRVQLLLSPGLLLLLLVLAGWLTRNGFIRRLAQIVTGGAIVICLLIILFIYTGGDSTETIEVPRMLSSTIYKALFYPNFSNRSYAAPFYGGIFALLMFMLANLEYRGSR